MIINKSDDTIKSCITSLLELPDDVVRFLCFFNLNSSLFFFSLSLKQIYIISDAVSLRFPALVKYWHVEILTGHRYLCSVWKILYSKAIKEQDFLAPKLHSLGGGEGGGNQICYSSKEIILWIWHKWLLH